MNLMLLIIMLAIVFLSGSNLKPWKSFTWINWLAIAGMALANVGSQTLRFKAI
jgi:hypothetical protein